MQNSLNQDSVVLIRDGENVTREQFRAEKIASIPDSYSPLFHLIFPSAIGISVIVLALSSLRHVSVLDLWFVPLVYMMSNAVEWHAHRDLLHTRVRFFEVLYDRHTPVHHRIFMTDDMAIRDRKEFKVVLVPTYGIFLILLTLAPVVALIAHFAGRNLACLFLATTVFYAVSYEWLHLAYHLPETSFVGRLLIVRVLRRHHAIHHDPRLMRTWNFNVTVPLWDWVRGTKK